MFFLVLMIVVYVIIYMVFSEDINAVKERDPAAKSSLEVLLLYPGIHALVAYRMSHRLLKMGIPLLARWLSQSARFFTGIEIHPGAQIGRKFFIDHGMGVVIGETAIIGDNVLLYQGVTLGGTGKETGKRHPTIGDHVVIGAGAKILGNITIGDNSYIGANSVVLKNIPSNSTVVGIPGRITKQDGQKIDSLLDHAHVNDPVMDSMNKLLKRLKSLEDKTGHCSTNKDDYII